MVTLASRIKVSKPVKLLGVISFLFMIWILYSYRIIDKENLLNESELGSEINDENVVTTPKPDLKVVKVDVYYECLCPDSRYFVLHELLPTFEKVGSMMDIHLWPYGKATTTVTEKGYEFSCQHGEQECIGNIYHACVEKIVEDMTKKLELIKCMISDNYEPENIAKKCASEGGIDFEEIQTCASGQEGKELHFKAGLKTEALHPKVSFIPTIEIDDDQNSQKAILKNLLKEVCASYSTQYLTHNEKLANCP
eukprot:GFUD01023449.1.p1 GENE.GFUD01023449.1~~GFUD01023449.1.p1  ORF type:complete len:252 (-),score=50.39 GFUD01023449.1:222-977(-)